MNEEDIEKYQERIDQLKEYAFHCLRYASMNKNADWYMDAAIKTAAYHGHMSRYIRKECSQEDFEKAEREYEESLNRASVMQCLYQRNH